MKALPVCVGVITAVFLPVVILAFYPGNVSVSMGYLLSWSAVFIGGAYAAGADNKEPFIPAMIAGLWAGVIVVLVSPAREDFLSSGLTVSVYAFMAVCGARARYWRRKAL